jgi:hypothetical protein
LTTLGKKDILLVQAAALPPQCETARTDSGGGARVAEEATDGPWGFGWGWRYSGDFGKEEEMKRGRRFSITYLGLLALSLSTLQTPLLLSLKQQTREMTNLPLDSMVFTVQSLRE